MNKQEFIEQMEDNKARFLNAHNLIIKAVKTDEDANNLAYLESYFYNFINNTDDNNQNGWLNEVLTILKKVNKQRELNND